MGPVLGALAEAVWRHRGRTAAALALLLLAKMASVSVPLALKGIVDRFSLEIQPAVAGTSGDVALPEVIVLPVFLLLAYALLRFASTLFSELRDLLFARVAHRTVSEFAERAFAHLLSLSPRFHAERSTGALVRDVERGTGGIAFLLGAGLFTLVPTLVEFGAVLVVLLAAGYSLWFPAIIGITFFAYGTYTALMLRRREARQRDVNEIESRTQGMWVDAMLNVEMVKSYAREDFEQQRFGGVQRRWVESSVANQRALSALHVGQSALIAGGVAAVMLLAGQYTLSGRMSVGDLILVNAYLIQICLPLNALGFVWREAIDALVNTEKLLALLGQPVEIRDAEGAKPLRLSGGAVQFDGIDFGYEAGRPILAGFSLQIEPGQTVAVVGGSGSGKSTIARLLLRLYDPQTGRVTIDGQDLRQVTQESLHRAIGVVAQDTALFNESIAYNIAYGRPGAGMAEIIEACRAAQVHEFIASLPQQYETIVGERGLKLSGGERQRISIARALLKNPPLLIFDEATSALDTRAERAIQAELDRIAVGRTTLVVAHRLSTIVDADHIVVMDQGRIVEAGRHEALLQRDGLYAQLWNLQRQQREFERLERRLARQPVNLGVVLAGTVDALRGAIEARRIALYTDIDSAQATVSGDPGVFAQVFHELLAQAVETTPGGGRIEIRLERADTDLRVCIADGRTAEAPLPPRPPAAPSALVPVPPDPLELRTLIERQGGRFAVELPGEGHGLRTTIEMPLHAIAVPAEAATPPVAAERGEDAAGAPKPPSLAGVSVMCIDDHADALESLALLLRVEGAEVLPFTRGAEALAWLQARPSAQWPRLLVCDISLGDEVEDGHQVMRRVRQLEAQRGVPLPKRLPAVALTGHAKPQDRLSALMAGFQMHFTKPVEGPVLAQALAALAAGPMPG